MHLLFVTPPLDGPLTGGTLYNRELTQGLARDGVSFRHCAIQHAAQLLSRTTPDILWIDSLYLAEVPELCRRAGAHTRVGILLHYLPALLQNSEPESLSELSPSEQAALLHVDLVLVPSTTLRDLLLRLAPELQIACVAPGIDSEAVAHRRPRDHSSAMMICNVTENNGVRVFLEQLARQLAPSDRFRLLIAGRLDVEPAYARACVAEVASNSALAPHIGFLDEIAQAQVFEQLAHSALLVSASRMESYGMALAEARAHGTPILARAGGHVAAHVDPAAGGQLVADEAELARAFVALMRRPTEIERRIALAEAARQTRSWHLTALEFRSACTALLR
jgi:glycosyltransferase involved in cell wall biosynthesis